MTSGAIATFEGPNEYDLVGGTWVAPLRSFQQNMYNQCKSQHPAIPVIGPSIVWPDDLDSLGNVSGMCDYGCVHSYPNHGGIPENNEDPYSLGGMIPHAANAFPGKPLIATETGNQNSIDGWGVSEDADAKYLSRAIMNGFLLGYVRTYKYELLNEGALPGTPANAEQLYGLLRSDLTAKPNFTAIKNLIALFNDKGNSFTPASLNYSLTGSTGNVKSILYQKRDGDFYLVLWQAVPCFDTTSKTNIINPNVNVTLSLGTSISAAYTYLPLNSTSVVDTYANTSSISLSIPDHLMVVRLSKNVNAGDVNGDGVVNAADLNIVKGQFGRSGSVIIDSRAERDGNGRVDAVDIGIVTRAMGK